MPSLFCLIGSYWCDHRDRMILWPVTWRHQREELVECKDICDRERDSIVSDLEVLWAKREGLTERAKTLVRSRFLNQQEQRVARINQELREPLLHASGNDEPEESEIPF